MGDKLIVMRDSPDAAQYRTDIKGWVSRDGLFYGDGASGEQTARYAGCTHVPCRLCGAPTQKHYLHCQSCRSKMDIEKYEAMPRMPWDGESLLYSETKDCYYRDIESAEDELEENQSLEDLRLVICKANYVPELDSSYCIDRLAEDDEDVPDVVADAIDAFNKAVHGVVLSWSPGRYALELTHGESNG